MTESKSVALPLGYIPSSHKKMVEEGGFEPPNPQELIYSQPRLATSLLLQLHGADYRNRTHNLLITSQLLYLLS